MASTPLTDSQIAERLTGLPGWERSGDQLVRTYVLPSYVAGLSFASAVGVVCEARDHHPEIVIGWKRVTVRFSTHDAGNKITAKDCDAAAAIDALGYPRPA